MNKSFDQKIRHELLNDQVEVPAYIHQRTEKLLEALPEKDSKPHLRILPGMIRRSIATAACFLFLTLVLLPNFSVTYANAMEEIPIIGNLVQIFTIRNYSYFDGNHELDAHVPKINDPNFDQISSLINKDVNELTGAVIQQFYEDLEISHDTGYGSIHIDYETVTNTDVWFTLKLTVNEVEAGSNTYFRFYHIDRINGRYVTFGNLFDSDGTKSIEQIVLAQMATQAATDPDTGYWTDEEPGTALLSEDQNFFFNEAGNLVVVFNKYDVGPGSIGCPEFELTPEEFGQYMNSGYEKLFAKK